MNALHDKKIQPSRRIGCGRSGAVTTNRRGSALFLVTVTLVLMAILGTTYIQMARMDRVATRRYTNGDIGAVIVSSIRQIQSVLYNDLVDAEGNFFNGNIALDTSAGAGDEPYDYPWTSPWPPFEEIVLRDGTTATVKGGKNDDRWLASTEPDFDTDVDKPRWPHITNLNGIYLRIPKTGTTQPEEHIVTLTGTFLNTDTSLPGGVRLKITGDTESMDTVISTWESWGVDADGDGIPDSRWTYPPIRRIGDVSYVMAVRIIDNSSLVNANVALSQVDSSDSYSASTDAPRWWYPSEIDLGRFIIDMGTAAGTNYIPDLERMLAYRLGVSDPASLPTPWGFDPGDREHFWSFGPAMYGNYGDPGGEGAAYQSLGIKNELDLRYRNGLNNYDLDTTIEDSTDGMPLLTREAVEDETSYNDFLGMSGPLTAAKIKSYFEDEPRHQMTVVSGAAIFAPPISVNGSTTRVLKKDLNDLIDSGATESPKYNRLSDAIHEVYNADWVSETDANRPLSGFDHYSMDNPYPDDWSTREWADQFAACIVDYADADNRITVIDRTGSGGKKIFGMESLPYIAEVYAQSEYSTPGGLADTEITWNQTGVRGYVIEIRNPFNIPVSLVDVHLFVNGTDWGTLSELTGSELLEEIRPDEVFLLRRDSGGGPDDEVAALIEMEAGFAYPNKFPDTDPGFKITKAWPIGDGTVTIELRAKDSVGVGTTFDWAYSSVSVEGLAGSYTEDITADLGSATDYRQVLGVGNGNRINVMLVREGDFETLEVGPSKDGPFGREDRSEITLGNADKTSFGLDDVVDPDTNQILFSGRDEIVQVGELAQITVLGPNETMTVADAWVAGSGTDPSDVSEFMPVFDTDERITKEFGEEAVESGYNLNVPHAVALLDWFTTMSPAVDGLDNDGDGEIDEDDEQFVPGTININTIPTRLLDQILPIPDSTIRQRVIDGIIKYRDNHRPFEGVDSPYMAVEGGITDQFHRGDPDTGPIQIEHYRTNPGIARLGELMEIVHRGDSAELDTLDTLANTSTGDERTLGGVVVDFDNPSDLVADGISNDREEEAMIVRWLMQTCSVRSDVFTAYVLIKGYPSGDFSLGPVESARFFAVFDRSRITSSADSVRVLGVYRVE